MDTSSGKQCHFTLHVNGRLVRYGRRLALSMLALVISYSLLQGVTSPEAVVHAAAAYPQSTPAMVIPSAVFANHFNQANPFFALLRTLLQRAQPAVSDLLGMKGPRTYLILVQNNHELRPTGGFITAVGQLTLENSAIRELNFVDSYSFFREDLEYPMAPKPLQKYMNAQLLMLRDANWSPDLATTAQLIKGFYRQQTGETIAGVITVDLQAATLLVDAFSPLTVPGVETPVTGENFIDQAIQFWEKPIGSDATLESRRFPEWMSQRKDFIPTVAQAALQRLRGGEVSYAKLLWNLQKALRVRAIQIWLTEPFLAQQLAILGWDGELRPAPNADFLTLIDTNMGFNKVDAVLQRTLSYTVTWPDGPTAPGVATAVITYTHPLSLPGYTCTNFPDFGKDYAFLIERCYYNYVRLYTVVGSKLIAVEGVDADSVATQRAEKQTQYFGGFFMLPAGQQQTVTFTYRLPDYLTPQNYRLLLQRQAGSKPLPVTINIHGQTLTTTLAAAKLWWPSP